MRDEVVSLLQSRRVKAEVCRPAATTATVAVTAPTRPVVFDDREDLALDLRRLR